MSDTTTQDYLDAIQAAKENGHTVDIDFSQLPKGVDAKAITSAMGSGLSDAHTSALDDAANNGHTVTQDFSVTHPILNAVEKTAELGGMVAGGIGGASTGALTAPVTGPVGAVAGGIAGAGLGYGAVKSGADALNQTLGYTPPQDLATGFKQTAEDVGEGAKMQAMGEGAGAATVAGVQGAKAAFPIVAKLLTKLPPTVAKMFMDNPDLPKQYAGKDSDISDAVKGVQDGLETLHQQASQLYATTLKQLGLAGPKTMEEIALSLMDGEAKTVSSEAIGQKTLDYKTAPNLSDSDKLAMLSDINQDINSHLKWAKAGQSLDPISNKLTPYLEGLKTEVQRDLSKLPGGVALQKADDVWHAFRQIYNSLQPNLKDVGEATKWLTNVVSDSGTASNTAKNLLATLDKTVGQPVADTAQKQIASSLLKKPLADTVLGKMAAVMSIVHPARALTLPLVGVAQSPYIQTKTMSGLMALQKGIQANPEMVPAALMGLKQVNASLPAPDNSNDVQDLVDNAQK